MYDAEAWVDRRAVFVFIASLVLLAPAQGYLFTLDLAECAGVLAIRAAQGLVLGIGACMPSAWWARHRTEALGGGFALLWALHFEANRRLLLLAVEDAPMRGGTIIATCVAMSLVLHAALPFDRERALPDAHSPRAARSQTSLARRRGPTSVAITVRGEGVEDHAQAP